MQSLEGAQQGDIEWPAGHGIIDGLAVGLGSPDDIVYGFGASFDFQGIDTDFDKSSDMFDGAEIFRIHDVSAMLVFQDGKKLAGPFSLLDQIDPVGGRMAGMSPSAEGGFVPMS